MNDTLALANRRFLSWPRVLADPLVLIGLIVGFTPVLAGLLFTTYGYHVSPAWAEGLRQLDAPFILVELTVVFWARHAGMDYRAVFALLDRPARIAVLIFLSTFWLSSVFVSEHPAYSTLRAAYWIIHVAFGFAVFHLAGAISRAGLIRCGVAAVAGFVAFLPLIAIHFVSAPDPSQVREGQIIWSSAIPGCLSIRHLGIWTAMVLALAIGTLWVRNEKQRDHWLTYVFIALATAVLFWSGTRGGVYGLAGALVVSLAIIRSAPPLRSLAFTGIAIGAGIFVSELWLPPDGAFGFLSRAATGSSDDLQAVTSSRTVLWIAMVKAFIESPIIGVGEGAVFWLTAIGDARHVQPHNAVVQMLSTWGLIASVAAGYLVARLLWLVHRMARRDAIMIPVVLMIDCLLIMSLADGVLYFSRFIMWFAAAGAISLAIAVRGVAASDPSPSPLPQEPSVPVR